MAKYLLLLYDDPADYADLGPEEMQRILAKFGAWADRLRAERRLVSAEKLSDANGRTLRSQAGGQVRVEDGPYSETKEVVGGFFLIEADDYEAAVAIARECPELELGGTVEVREIESV